VLQFNIDAFIFISCSVSVFWLYWARNPGSIDGLILLSILINITKQVANRDPSLLVLLMYG
jgi:hypothetical protein